MTINDVKHMKGLKLLLAVILALVMEIGCPASAYADSSGEQETTTETVEETVEGYMTITLQEDDSNNSSQATSAKSTKVQSNQSVKNKSDTSDNGKSGSANSTTLAKTGDIFSLLCTGIISLMLAGAFICFKARVFAKDGRVEEYAARQARAKKQILVVGIAAVVIALSCFGLFAGKQAAFAEEQAQNVDIKSNVSLLSTVSVDENGKVLNNGILFRNKSQWTLSLGEASAPDGFGAWKASFETKTSSPEKENTGAWSTQAIPKSVLEELKDSEASEAGVKTVTKKFTLPVSYTIAKTEENSSDADDANTGSSTDTETDTKTDTSVTIPEKATITTSVENGTITDSCQIVKGKDVTIDYAANTGHSLASVEVDDKAEDIAKYPASYTFSNAQEDHEIKVVYEKSKFKITIGDAENGTVTGGGDIEYGDDAKIEYKPDTGYHVDTVIIDGEKIDVDKYPDSYIIEDVTGDHTVEVIFAKDKFKITVDAGANGTVTGGGEVEYGSSATVKYTPNAGYKVSKVTVDGKEVDVTKYPDSYVFSSVTGAHTVKVEFEKEPQLLCFAVYSEDDKSLDFYKRELVALPEKGSTFNGKTATTVYSNVENTSGSYPAWQKGLGTSKPSPVLDVSFVDSDISPNSTEGWFAYFENCKQINNLNNLNTSYVTDMSYTFSYCESLTNLDLSKFNTSKVANMACMFNGCKSLANLDVTKFDTSKVTNMRYMFDECSSLVNLDVAKFDTSEVTDMTRMFSLCKSLTTLDLAKFNTSKVTSMYGMFYGSSSLVSLDVAKFDTSNTTTMAAMFSFCSSLKSLNVAKFDTSNVTKMSNMFNECSSLTALDVAKFNTSKVTDMSDMFDDCSSLTSLNVVNFDTSSVTLMNGMFSSCSSLTALDVAKFNTSKVTSMANMFDDCSSLTNLDVTKFDTSNVNSMGFMFYGCSSLTNIDVSKFDTSKVASMYGMFEGCRSIKNLDVTKFITSKVSSLKRMFNACDSLASIDVTNFDTAKVTDMSNMFSGCYSLKSLDVTKFDTAKVTNMSYMFEKCANLKTDCSSWNVLNVKSHTGFSTGALGVKEPNWAN